VQTVGTDQRAAFVLCKFGRKPDILERDVHALEERKRQKFLVPRYNQEAGEPERLDREMYYRRVLARQRRQECITEERR
jgi:hypothetical protein